MSDEIAKLKAELEALNLQCQLARDHEIRHALQRTRLETARMQLMLKIVEAVAPVANYIPAATAQHTPAPDAIKTVAIDAARKAPAITPRQKRKPDGLPSLPDMVLSVLGTDATAKGMKPREITVAIRKAWWPEAPMPAVGAAAWKLAGRGRLENRGGRYKLNGHG